MNETCGDYGGLTQKNEPCKRTAGWGVPDTDTGRCKTHLDQEPSDVEVIAPNGYALRVSVDGTLEQSTRARVEFYAHVPDPEPEPIPEGPHPAVPHIDHDPVGNPVATTHKDTMAPASVTLTALGQTQRLVALVEPLEGTGQVYTWVTLPDGRHGLWGCASVDREAGVAVLAENGPWIHTGIPWTAEVETLPAGDGEAEYEWGWTVLHGPLPDWTTIGGREVSHLEVTAEPVQDPASLPAPGQPHFEATTDGGIVSWTPSEGADNYRVRWRGNDAFTPEPSVEIVGLQLGDWVCVHPRIGDAEGENYRCNTWTE